MTQLMTRPRHHTQARSRGQRTLRLFLVDAFVAVLFVLVMDVPLTGVPLHEWLGIAIAAGSAAHLVQHSNWVRTTAARIRSTGLLNRLNGIMTVLLFISFATIIGSGLVVSEAALPWLGIDTSGSASFWLWLHLASIGFTLWLTAFHIALNWKWIATTTNRFVVQPVRRFLESG